MSHTATNCHTMSQTATQCHRLSHSVTHCHSVSLTVTVCHSQPRTATQCHTVSHPAPVCPLSPQGQAVSGEVVAQGDGGREALPGPQGDIGDTQQHLLVQPHLLLPLRLSCPQLQHSQESGSLLLPAPALPHAVVQLGWFRALRRLRGVRIPPAAPVGMEGSRGEPAWRDLQLHHAHAQRGLEE